MSGSGQKGIHKRRGIRLGEAPESVAPPAATAGVLDGEAPGLPAIRDAADATAARYQEIAVRYGDDLPYDRGRVIHETRFFWA